MKLVYPAFFSPWEDGKGYTVEFPDLPGCVTEGSSLAEAIEMAEDAASGWVLGELEEGKRHSRRQRTQRPLSRPGGFCEHGGAGHGRLYGKSTGKKAVRKNLTIPAWLNTFAEKQQVNFSQVLTDALTNLYQKAQ